MSIHDRAWNGISLLIYGKSATVPMQIEQAIADASPSNEINISSFESFDSAYKFCKSTKNVGLLLILENCGETPFEFVFRELGAHYETQGLPAYGLAIYESKPDALSAKLVGKTTRFLDYIHIDAFLNSNNVTNTLNTIWDQFVSSFEDEVISRGLQSSLLSVCEEIIGEDSVHFESRVIPLLLGNANVSWLEAFSTKWSHFADIANKQVASFLKPHQKFLSISEISKPQIVNSHDEFLSFMKSNILVCKKVSTAAQYLNRLRIEGSLDKELETIETLNKPGAPALLRHIAKNKKTILTIATDAAAVRGSVVKAA